MHNNKRIIALLVLFSFLLCACQSLNYNAKILAGHFEIMSKVRPIKQILEDDTVLETLKARLAYLLEARMFASGELMLPNNASYTGYADIGRDAVSYSVFATAEFNLDSLDWNCIFLVGCFNYKSYYSEIDAKKQVDVFRKRGFDSSLNPSIAYSTLGWFDDPVISPMLAWSDWQVVGTIFHELAHQKLFITGDSNFSEGFATAVGTLGLMQWLDIEQDIESRNELNESEDRESEMLSVFDNGRNQLQQVYQSGQSVEQKRIEKQAVFDGMRADHSVLAQQWNGNYYAEWFSQDLNNSHLLAVSTYNDFVPAFFQLFQEANLEWDEFYRRAIALSKLNKKTRDQQLVELNIRWKSGMVTSSLASSLAGKRFKKYAVIEVTGGGLGKRKILYHVEFPKY